MTGTALLGDIGGTNARFALARNGQIVPESLRSFANDRFYGIDALIGHVLDGAGPVDAISLAVAGPLIGGRIRMTNRPWVLEPEALKAHAPEVRLINDLSAHVLAVPYLSGADCAVLLPGAIEGNGQWLVVNLGTGFNAAQGVMCNGRATALAAERGMCALPAPVTALLRDAGAQPPEMAEHLFSGPGLAALKDRIGGAAEGVFARCLGLLLRDLITATLPFDGVALCGGVARAVADGPAVDTLTQVLAAPYAPYPFLSDVPIRLITAPDAALRGCLAALD